MYIESHIKLLVAKTIDGVDYPAGTPLGFYDDIWVLGVDYQVITVADASKEAKAIREANLTVDDLKAAKRNERNTLLVEADHLVNEAIDAGQPTTKPSGYRTYLKNFPKQSGEWWTLPILSYDDWLAANP